MNVKLIRRGAAAFGVAALAAAGVVGLGATAANAAAVSPGTTAYWISPVYDSQEIAVAGGSGSIGTRLIQWYNDGGDEQKWYFDGIYDDAGHYQGFELRNKNSGMCMDTDGAAGDALFQTYCNPADTGQIFNNVPNFSQWGIVTSYSYINKETGLALDVSGYSYGEGANIDLWYQNGQANQDFWLTATS
ncbi:MAG TPA: RICIN domain-containing protein [Actinocrinis sp.]|uniref:RICIN domain-containing protein n=1 Tax=Actinocrinis sp. TaxID=1920516 RepID=UPI002DDDA48D|nr:RICIN domain-containing protein [Actinocrinis sp.]HEV3169658.1 RICIN domain-containing protein [Actinocrinis sp.]